jgi:acetyltransferase-like isoleucine patch superfamily enzyme
MGSNPAEAAEDPLHLISRGRTWLHTRWIKNTYPFAEFGRGTSVDHTCDIRRSIASAVALGANVYLAPDIWLNVTEGTKGPRPKIVLGAGCRIGRRTTISARNHIHLEEDVLTAPSVFLMDHNHAYADITKPIHEQGVTSGGTITIGRNCWLGCGVVVLSGQKDLVIGRNSVLAANAVVTQSFPDFSVIAGNPAKLVRIYDPQTEKWTKPEALSEGTTEKLRPQSR